MSTFTININQVTVLGKTATKLVIAPVFYTLNSSSVNIGYELKDNNDTLIVTGKVTISDISNWGTDDSVLISAILTALSLTAA
jgi:hypothetical protein